LQDLVPKLFVCEQPGVASRPTRNLTEKEWKHYFGDEPYRKTRPDLP
jgi:hypothetical protein